VSGLQAELRAAYKARKLETVTLSKVCQVRRALRQLDAEDRAALLAAIYGEADGGGYLVSPLAIQHAMSERGITLNRRTVSSHRMRECVGCQTLQLT
jgi:hypothetical protein